MDTLMPTPAWADRADAPTSAARTSILVFIVLFSFVFAFKEGGLIDTGTRPNQKLAG